MKHLDLLNEFNTSLAQLAVEIETSSAMQLYDINKVSENLVLGLIRELFGWNQLRNLNTDEKTNFPGIDLADDNARVAIQVTSTSGLDKIKNSIETFRSYRLNERYDRLIVYVLTRKQGSYSQAALNRATEGAIDFIADRDVMDYRDLASRAVNANPRQLLAVLEVLRSYQRGGVSSGLAEADFDPPTSVFEKVNLNLLEVYFPSTIYVADLRADDGKRQGKRHRNERKVVREILTSLNLRAPSDYEVNANRLITFHALDDEHGPFAKLIESGTVTPLGSREFYSIDDDHERIFKSLLRFSLQQKLFKHGVHWKHEDGLFVFMPLKDNDLLREETWVGQKTSTRRVFERKLNKNDPNKLFVCKHFAFGADFVRADDGWYIALTPDWFFSYGDDFRRSAYADESISWLKRKEVNRTVSDHFRFLTSWLGALDQDDLFSVTAGPASTMTFGNAVSFGNHPALDDDAWLPLRDLVEDEDTSPIKGLFDTP
ncbi:MAG: SMEK domain-containing protein [Betaproteobacteria bacterium]|jgi:hypothetical protein|uniref:SMEK domain-containing protein n=1 Tax=Candidatus Accumulibacter propinquus TaxID=2954380 RepID=UPI002FC36BA1|nr:SMEK domain-containing protein [Betaproteobacteria bacterium]